MQSELTRQVFVANPNKPAPIAAILRRNKDKLLVFLSSFHNDKEDEQFNARQLAATVLMPQDEKQFLLAQIRAL